LGAAVCLITFLSLQYHERVASFVAAFAATVASGVVYTALDLSMSSAQILAAFSDPMVFLFRMTIVITVTAPVNGSMASLLSHATRTSQDSIRP